MNALFNQVSTDLTVAVNKTDCSGLYSCLGGACTTTHVVTSDTVTAVASEGTGPYTYAWTMTIFGLHHPNATAPAAAATAFNGTLARNETITAVFVCTATDSLGRTAVSAPVSVRLTYDWDSGA